MLTRALIACFLLVGLRSAAAQQAVPGPASAFASVFYNNDFSYLSDSAQDEHFLGDCFKQRQVGRFWTLDVGGQYRVRQHAEHHMRSVAGPVTAFGGLTGVNDDFLLQRTRVFGNLTSVDQFVRVYAEMIDAHSNFERFPPRIIEQNPTDMLNLFVDFRPLEIADGDVTIRVGRQELLYGSERLVSPLDWANTRRTFEGAKAFWASSTWSVDAFYVYPVIVDPREFDSADRDQQFAGFWATSKAIQGQTIDCYYLVYRNESDVQPVKDMITNDFLTNTIGGRWQGSRDAWLWDVEGGVQFGKNTDRSDRSAGFWTTGIGRKWDEYEWKPTLWAYYDWASGSNDTGAGNGFNHLFPLGHKYLGFMDLFGRSNIETPNLLFTAQPHERVQLLVWYYYFFLANGRDTPYNINQRAFNHAVVPGSRDLGHELDLLVTFAIDPRQTLLFGYSHFFAGAYYSRTPGVPTSDDADFFYSHYLINF